MINNPQITYIKIPLISYKLCKTATTTITKAKNKPALILNIKSYIETFEERTIKAETDKIT